MRLFALIAILLSFPARAGELEDLCGESELISSFKVASAERREAAKDRIIHALRDEVLAKLDRPAGFPAEAKNEHVLAAAATLPTAEFTAFTKSYFTRLEAKVAWGEGKKKILGSLGTSLDAIPGSAEKKAELKKLLTDDTIVSVVDFVDVLKEATKDLTARQRTQMQGSLANACGLDGTMPGGLAFKARGKRVFAFCPAALLRASLEEKDGKIEWRPSVKIDALLFTAFHELGHVLGADVSSSYRSLYTETLQCLHRSLVQFKEQYDDEVLADFWGAVALKDYLKENQIGGDAAAELIVLNLTPLKNGSMMSHVHLPFGARQQLVLGELCRHLSRPTSGTTTCNLGF